MRLSIPVRLLFLFLCVLLATQPALPAQPPAQRAAQVAMPDRFLAAGETYLDGIATALGRGLELQQQVTALHTARDAGGYAALAEADLPAAQQTALDLAAQSATAAGAVTPLVTTITDLGHTAPDPLDLAALATDGLPAALRANLEDPTLGPGLDQATIAALDTAFKQQITRQHDLARSALPTAQRQALQSLGLEAAEIDQIAAVMAAQGLAQPGLTDRRAQFAATQAELTTTRTQALVTAVRLVTTAVLARQAQGQFSRAVTADELAALADDELRLLLHIQQVQALADTETTGAGHWWMIQRHATRAAERLERIIRESHNLALVGDLFVVRYLATLPLMAQAGDPDAARDDLAAPAALLTYALQGRGAPAAAGGPEPATAGKGAGPAQPDAAAIAAAVAHLRTRLDAPQAQTTGQFAETDEANNQVGLHLLVGLPDFGDIGADILAATLEITQSVSAEEVWTVFVAIVTGDTEDPALLVANILFSFLPVVGAIPDIYTLFVDPSIFVKALSIIGIVGSIGDLPALLGVTAPLAGAAFLADASVAVIKPLARNTPDALVVLDRLNIEQAFTVGGDLILVGVDELIVLDRGLGSSLDEAVGIVQDVFTGATRIWDDFGALTARSGPDLLLELGITPGSLLTGRVLRQGSDLSPQSMRAVTNIGNDIPDVGNLSDEAAEGLGEATEIFGEQKTRQIFSDCLTNAFGEEPGSKGPGLASVLPLSGLCGTSLAIFNSLTPKAQQGFGKISSADARGILLNNPNAERVGKLLDNIPIGESWSSEAIQGVENLVNRNLDQAAQNIFANYSDEVAKNSFILLRKVTTDWSEDAVEGVARLVKLTAGHDVTKAERIFRKTGGANTGEKMFRRIKLADDQAIDGWSSFVGQLTSTDNWIQGGYHVLHYMEELGFENVRAVEVRLKGNVGGKPVTRIYDIVDNDNYRFELKSIEKMRAGNFEELTRDLEILSDEDLRKLTWVFRRPNAQQIAGGAYTPEQMKQAVIEHVKKIRPDAYSEGIFTEANIDFIGNGSFTDF